jgi:iron complex outermembrane receptor protein
VIVPSLQPGPPAVYAFPVNIGLPMINGCNFIAYGPGTCDPKSPNNPYVNYSTYVDQRTGLAIAPNQTVNSRGESLNIDWKLGKDLDLQSISAYRSYDAGFGINSDGTPFPLQRLYQSLSHKQTSEELRLNGKAGNFLDYTVGGFYFDQTSTETGRIDLGYVGFDFLHGPDPVDATTWALFAHGIFHLVDKLDLSLGVRYTDEKKTYTYARHNPDGSLIQSCVGGLGDPANPPNCLISSLNGISNTFRGTRTDYRAALSYKFTNDVMGYVQYSTGYKGGGVNPRPFFNVQAITFQPETSAAGELGIKSQFLNNSLRLNAAVFYNKYKAVQLTLNDCTALFGGPAPGVVGPPGVPCLASTNAGDANVKGGELELNWRPVEPLQVDASVGYVDFAFSSIYPAFVAAGPASGVDLTKKPPYTPKLKWNVGLQYDIGLAGHGTLTPRVDATYQDTVYGDIANTPLETIDSYTLVNARVMWRSENKEWQASLACNNLTDKLYYTTKTDQVPAGAGSAYGAPAMPRTFMVSVKRTF